MTLVRVQIDHLDLAFLDINESIARFTRQREKRAGSIRDDFPDGAQGLHVSRGQRRTLHLP